MNSDFVLSFDRRPPRMHGLRSNSALFWARKKVPNAKCGEKIRSGYLTLAFSEVPNAKRGDKITIGYLTTVF